MSPTNGHPGLILDLGGVIVDHDNAKCFARLSDLLDERPFPDELSAFIAASGVGDGSISVDELFDAMSARMDLRPGGAPSSRPGTVTSRSSRMFTNFSPKLSQPGAS